MDTQFNVQPEQLQLFGVTWLFIATKLAEVHPLSVAKFANFTSGACTEVETIDITCEVLN